MYSNFNVKELEDLRDRSTKVFSAILENVRTIKKECGTMGEIVASDDSNLALRWQNFNENMESPINNIEDTFVIIKALLDAYITNTKANEEKAVKELEALDLEITSLATRAESLLNGLISLKGIGFGATAILIPGLHIGTGSGGTNDPIAVTMYAPPNAPGDPTPVTMYAPPFAPDDPIAVTMYAPPNAPIDPAPVMKYAPPSFPDPTMTIKYAPPEPPVVAKYAPPSFPEPPVVAKYAPPGIEVGDPIAVTMYAPPNFFDSLKDTKSGGTGVLKGSVSSGNIKVGRVDITGDKNSSYKTLVDVVSTDKTKKQQ